MINKSVSYQVFHFEDEIQLRKSGRKWILTGGKLISDSENTQFLQFEVVLVQLGIRLHMTLFARNECNGGEFHRNFTLSKIESGNFDI